MSDPQANPHLENCTVYRQVRPHSPVSIWSPPRPTAWPSVYCAGIQELFHRPACISAGRSTPEAVGSEPCPCDWKNCRCSRQKARRFNAGRSGTLTEQRQAPRAKLLLTLHDGLNGGNCHASRWYFGKPLGWNMGLAAVTVPAQSLISPRRSTNP